MFELREDRQKMDFCFRTGILSDDYPLIILILVAQFFILLLPHAFFQRLRGRPKPNFGILCYLGVIWAIGVSFIFLLAIIADGYVFF
jgi:hypothetical protein